MPVRALRGATTVPENSRAAILQATDELLRALMEANDLVSANILSAVFSATDDLDAAYPAEAARALGWRHAGLMCLQEMHVPGSLRRCLRVLVTIESELPQEGLTHCYLHEAATLRPDLSP